MPNSVLNPAPDPVPGEFDLPSFLPYLLNQAAEECGLGFQRIYKARYGLLRSEWRVLFHLGLFGPMTATRVGQLSRTHKTKISRAVQRLSDLRFLRREESETDRRQEILHLTATGQAAYLDLQQAAAAYERRLTATLSPQETALLRDLLKRLANFGPDQTL